jgi:hypothetical protein
VWDVYFCRKEDAKSYKTSMLRNVIGHSVPAFPEALAAHCCVLHVSICVHSRSSTPT